MSRVRLRCTDEGAVWPGSAAGGGDPFCFFATMTFVYSLAFSFVSPPKASPVPRFWFPLGEKFDSRGNKALGEREGQQEPQVSPLWQLGLPEIWRRSSSSASAFFLLPSAKVGKSTEVEDSFSFSLFSLSVFPRGDSARASEARARLQALCLSHTTTVLCSFQAYRRPSALRATERMAAATAKRQRRRRRQRQRQRVIVMPVPQPARLLLPRHHRLPTASAEALCRAG
jgi:hypothetical protein